MLLSVEKQSITSFAVFPKHLVATIHHHILLDLAALIG
jgi:hypothetical protein